VREIVPSDFDGENANRANSARLAIDAFLSARKADRQDAVQDLLCNLAHYCDRTGEDLLTALRIAKTNYEAETQGPRPGSQFDRIAIDQYL
jgi:hypothetical protein